MSTELSREERAQAISSLERYFAEEFDQRLGNVAAGALLNYFLQELGPLVYNRAVAQVQERLQQQVQDLDIELHEEGLQYWRKRTPRPR
jgi:uncharacterized protein (DUF2164 family)